MPRTSRIRYATERSQLGLTHRQFAALTRIRVLHARFASEASLWSVDQMVKIADECEELHRTHFPEDWAARNGAVLTGNEQRVLAC